MVVPDTFFIFESPMHHIASSNDISEDLTKAFVANIPELSILSTNVSLENIVSDLVVHFQPVESMDIPGSSMALSILPYHPPPEMEIADDKWLALKMSQTVQSFTEFSFN